MVDSLSLYQLDTETTHLTEEFKVPNRNHQSIVPIENCFEQQSENECNAAYITLRNTLLRLIKLKTSFFTRSDNTL